MSRVSHKTIDQFKSPLRVVASFLLYSRETQRRRLEEKSKQLRDTRQQLLESQNRERQLQKQLAQQAQKLKCLTALTESHQQCLPDDPKLPYHSFGPKMIAMCCNLALSIGFRSSERALKIFWDYCQLETRLPVFETIRTWLMRVGVARLLLQKVEEDDGQFVWLVDHSCKVGTEKMLAILGIRIEDLPPPGIPLKHEDLTTLLIAAGTTWKREDVQEQYEKLVELIGAPLAVISDQAVELQEPVLSLENKGEPVLSLTDPKHKLANIIKSIFGSDERFIEFQKKLGQTRMAIQQTEMGHFTPPRQKPKARFMNLRATINWASMVQWHLSNDQSKSRNEVSDERMEIKLGWLKSFCQETQTWSRCLDVVSATLKFINAHGLSVGAARRLKKELDKLALCRASCEVKKRTLEFIKESEKKLKSSKVPNLRLPVSTEVLESVFGKYKQLEGQHSKGGLTSLLASFATLLQPITADEITNAFKNVSTARMREWVKTNLGNTLQAKKNLAYTEYRQATAT